MPQELDFLTPALYLLPRCEPHIGQASDRALTRATTLSGLKVPLNPSLNNSPTTSSPSSAPAKLLCSNYCVTTQNSLTLNNSITGAVDSPWFAEAWKQARQNQADFLAQKVRRPR